MQTPNTFKNKKQPVSCGRKFEAMCDGTSPGMHAFELQTPLTKNASTGETSSEGRHGIVTNEYEKHQKGEIGEEQNDSMIIEQVSRRGTAFSENNDTNCQVLRLNSLYIAKKEESREKFQCCGKEMHTSIH